MLKIALRGVREHLVRFGLSVLAVTLGVAFVAGTFSLRQMLSATFDDIVSSSVTADAYLRVPDSSGDDTTVGTTLTSTGLPIGVADTLKQIDGVASAFPAMQGPVTLVGADGTAVSNGQAPSFGMAFDPADPSNDGELVGSPPTSSDQIMVEKSALENSGLSIGDRTTVVIAGELRPVTVVGSMDWGTAVAGATIVFFDNQTAQAAFAPDGTVPVISVYADPAAGLSEQQLVDRIAVTGEAAGGEAVTAEQYRADTIASIEDSLGFISTFLMVFAALALFVGAFIIANTFTMTVRQRLREFALLRAVGASPAQVFAQVVVQAAVIGLLGSGLGLAGGIGLIELLRVVFAQMNMDLSGSVPLSVSTVTVSLLVGTVVSVLASLLPARRAALVPPVEAMRDELVIRDRSLVGRAIAGGALVVAGAVSVWWATVHPGESTTGAALGGGAAAVLLGVLAAGPVVAPAVVRVLALPVVALIRPLGRLARGNVTRSPRRTANTAGALTIGMALVGASAVLAASTQGSVATLVAHELHSDFVLRTDQTQSVPADLVNEVRALPGVDKVYPLPYSTALASTDSSSTAHDAVSVMGADPAALNTALIPQEESGDLTAVLTAGEAVVDSQLAADRGWSIGQPLHLTGGGGERTLRIGATMHSALTGEGVLVDLTTLDAIVPVTQQLDTTVMVTATPHADLETVRTALVQTARPYVVVSVMDAEEFVTSLSDQVQQVLVILYALLGLSVMIAGLGIVNTLALSVIERTREIGLLRAVGLGRLQLAGTVTIESVLTAVAGTTVGLLIGVGLASAIPTIYADQGLTELVVPWPSLIAMVLLAVAVGALAAVWPGVRAARLKVLDAISYE